MKNKSKVEELDATLVLMQKQSASDGVSDSEILEESDNTMSWTFRLSNASNYFCTR